MRPAIVVSSAEFQAVEQLYIVAAVTRNVTASSLGHRIVDTPIDTHRRIAYTLVSQMLKVTDARRQ